MFNKIAAFRNIHDAHLAARRGKRFRTSILKFDSHLEENLFALRRELLDKTYRHGPYREFIVFDSKKRLIKAPPFRDRVVHHAICRVIEPILEKGFIYDSYACRKGKGVHMAIRRLEKFIQSLGDKINRERERERVSFTGNILFEMRCFQIF